mgnify:CR=1 FL=1
MDFLLDALTNWLKEMLVGGIMENLTGMFDSVNQQVADISVQVGQTPQLERRHFQHDPEPLQLHHGADCWRDPGHRDDAGADPDDYRPQQPA